MHVYLYSMVQTLSLIPHPFFHAYQSTMLKPCIAHSLLFTNADFARLGCWTTSGRWNVHRRWDLYTWTWCRAPIESEKIDLKATLDVIQIPLRPVSSALSPLKPDRDLLPEEKTIHKLELNYKLKIEEAGGHTPTLPALNGYILTSHAVWKILVLYRLYNTCTILSIDMCTCLSLWQSLYTG